ncbi:iron-regulated protein A precursor [Flavobacterium sp. Sd200]|uniref:imelysin family protein n=1 Tax=Flavobacterium sp. Sd200 TaxID=2692211 RepID=UPI00136BFFFD|nr:imelysin family protein [Flavobacterium sp. Sd200]MXN91096.1 iron-regulated protein A precursor [Flavobacterium sp. Sd200]
MKKILLAIISVAFAAGCSSGDNNDSTGTQRYDKTALLIHWADNIIIPAFTNYQAKTTSLKTQTEVFTNQPTITALAALRQAWLEAYKAYQYVGIHDVGKASELYLIESTNIFPTDATGINNNIASGNYNLNQPIQYSRQGFPALDFLINGLAGSDADIVAFYTTNANSNSYKQYLTAVATRLKTVADAIVADWNGTYRETYISSNGSSISASVNVTTNNFVKNLEKDVRFPKLGVPAGLFSNGTTHPASVEAYYKNDVSKELLIDALKASQDFFNGKNFGNAQTGPSLKGYLDAVNAGGSTPLSTTINNQYATTLTAINGLNNSLSTQITTNNAQAVSAYNELQKIVVYTKSSMLSALSITIDYVDGDGD